MNLILFSPWKTASTELLKCLAPNFGEVVKEIFHEDYYEAKSVGTALCKNWHANVTVSPGIEKYVLGDRRTSQWKLRHSRIASDLLRFAKRSKGGVLFQVAESADLARSLFEVIQKKDPKASFQLRQSNYSPHAQGLSIYHNYLEGNPYFSGIGLLFLIFNDDQISSSLKSLVAGFSMTGAVLLAQQMISLLPSRCVVAVIKAYTAAIGNAKLPIVSALPGLADFVYRPSIVVDRYQFLFNEYFSMGGAQDLADARRLINEVHASSAFIRQLPVAKELIRVDSKGDRRVGRLQFDRCNSVNLVMSDSGSLRPMNATDKCALSTSIISVSHVERIEVIGGSGLSEIYIMIDGLAVDCMWNVAEHSRYCEISHECRSSIYIEMRCMEFPNVEITYKTAKRRTFGPSQARSPQ